MRIATASRPQRTGLRSSAAVQAGSSSWKPPARGAPCPPTPSGGTGERSGAGCRLVSGALAWRPRGRGSPWRRPSTVTGLPGGGQGTGVRRSAATSGACRRRAAAVHSASGAGHDAFGGLDLDPYLVGGRQGPLIEPVSGRAGRASRSHRRGSLSQSSRGDSSSASLVPPVSTRQAWSHVSSMSALISSSHRAMTASRHSNCLLESRDAFASIGEPSTATADRSTSPRLPHRASTCTNSWVSAPR